MERTNRTYALIVPFVEALAGLGLRHVSITPGSRNTPLSLAFAAHPGIEDWSHHDERSSAFFALGIAKATGTPAAAVCTSGTAAAGFLPAAIEARHARVPLLLLTADRPPELRDVGAPQAIDQIELYGKAVKWAHEVATPEATPELLRYMVALAGRAWAGALDTPAGPVHLNFPFRDPLVPEVEELPELPRPPRPRYVPGRLQPEERQLAEVGGMLEGRPALLVCGPVEDPQFPVAAASLAGAGGFPTLADPLSGLRAGGHDLSLVLAHGDPLARAGLLERHPPELVVRFGAPPTSKAVNQWLAAHPEIPQLVVDPAGWRDPGATAQLMLRSDPTLAAQGLAKAISTTAPREWTSAWVEADRVAGGVLREAVESAGFPSEPGVVAALAEALPAGAKLCVASSMPIRDVDAFFPTVPRPLRFLANRGANGIDGFVSTGLGVAVSDPAPTYLLAGDLSLLHDLTALGVAGRHQVPVTILVINNDGGGVFNFLPQAGFPDYFERHFGTPHGLGFARAADLFGIDYLLTDDAGVLREALAELPNRPRLIEVRTDRQENVEVHRAAWAAVERALSATWPPAGRGGAGA
ncbi:MAG: 2-succinyl-5-enolpyruvyl-6-hydroxy-3-cyclohexene-1-carboxylic-acid synthase [Acidimicrobiia bacterium]